MNLFRLIKPSGTLVNVGVNLAGFALPAVVGFLSTPVLIRHLGDSNFGILSLVWLIVGYLGLFDFGLSRSLTQFVAQNRLDSPQLVQSAISTSLWLSLPLSALAMLAYVIASPHLGIHTGVAEQTWTVTVIMLGLIALLMLSSVLKGILEGYELFLPSNVGRLILGIGFFLVPTAVSFYTTDMRLILGVLLIPRALSTVYYLVELLRRQLLHLHAFEQPIMKRLFSLGSWITVTNIVSPVMNGLDRFFLVNLLGAAAVAYYSVPSDTVGRLSIIPLSIGTVLLPKLAARTGQGAPDRMATYRHFIGYTLKLMLPICLVTLLVTPVLLRLWIGPIYEEKSTLLMRILTLGILVNAVANVPFTALQALGKARTTALIHLIELPFYLLGLWFAIRHWGLTGAAVMWSVRAAVDTLLMHLAFQKENKTHAIT